MPRKARKASETGFYHVVTKGDGGQLIFQNNGERMKYLRLLEQAAVAYSIEIHAYCLMANHVHLLVRDTQMALPLFMKTINERHAMTIARESGRVGHVYQGRFWSEPVENTERYLCTLRYIHANPEHAGICRASHYPWSSYQAYLGRTSFVKTDLALSLLGNHARFEEFSSVGCQFALPFAHSKLRNHLTSDELLRVAQALLGKQALADMRAVSVKTRNARLAKLSNVGFTENQIARLTGIGRSTIHHAISQS